jgi:hypothetical protein
MPRFLLAVIWASGALQSFTVRCLSCAIFCIAFSFSLFLDNFGPLCSFVILFCVFASLFLVGRAVVLGKAKLSGNYLADFWLGIELNPRMFGLELKFVALRYEIRPCCSKKPVYHSNTLFIVLL